MEFYALSFHTSKTTGLILISCMEVLSHPTHLFYAICKRTSEDSIHGRGNNRVDTPEMVRHGYVS
jgi:hypothetical protein